MNSQNTEQVGDQHAMVAIKVFKDHRVDESTEFRVEPVFYEDIITVLDKFAKLAKVSKNTKEEVEEEVSVCPHGYENCNEDDFESMCDECRQDRAEAHNDAMMDTYD